MSQWPATKASRVLAALLRIGWRVKRHVRGSHRILARPNWPDVFFPRMDPRWHVDKACIHRWL
ncbi:MAG: type II toxin-antitoxin system HicA family toxin [Planctomycetes bacterium]|nr:type II toxin-antitoxin system HicA family toxin [Planctomycetota bacterium]